MATQSIIDASGDEVAEYTFNDLLETTWDMGGYSTVTLWVDEAESMSLSSDTANVVEGLGNIIPTIATTMTLSSDDVNVIEGLGAVFGVSRAILNISSDITTQSISSTIPIDIQTLTLSAYDTEVFTSSVIQSDITILNMVQLDSELSVSSVIETTSTLMTLSQLTAIIPTWRLPYVGCEEVQFPWIKEEYIRLRMIEVEISISVDQEDIILNIDC